MRERFPADASDWADVLGPALEELEPTLERLGRARAEGACHPPAGSVFRAFSLCRLDQLRVVICGQDPYHGPGQANGLAFSVNPGVPLPPSLRNIYAELKSDSGSRPPAEWGGDLSFWARQGVLLLNSSLTVASGSPGSHSCWGWQGFTDRALSVAAERAAASGRRLVALLWGRDAQRKEPIFAPGGHHVLTAAHPSPLSAYRGFFGCRHFSRTNSLLQAQGLEPIRWSEPGEGLRPRPRA